MKQKVKYLLLALVSCALLCGIVVAANRKAQEYQLSVSTSFIMDTVIEQKLYGRNSQQAAAEIERRLREYEQQYSMYLPDSQISRINEQAGKDYTEVSQQCLVLLQQAIAVSAQSNGLFDITIAPLTRLWDITAEHPRVPLPQLVEQAKQLGDYCDILIDGNRVMLRNPGQAIDLGAVAKGAACTIIRQVAQEYEIKTGYVSVGGNLIVLGKDPQGEDFRFAIRDPQGEASEYIATLSLTGSTMATTGAYERWFEQDGKRYHHIIDPRTGYPAESDLLSVSVISEDGMLADCMSTALFIEGKQAALQRMQEEAYQLVIVDTDGNIYYSPSLEGNIQLNTDNQRDYHWN